MTIHQVHHQGPASQALHRALARIAEHEARVQAWAWFDEAAARQQAAVLDGQADALARGSEDHGGASSTVQSSLSAAPLLGLTVGLKDIIDTADMPTENGTVLHAGRRPAADAEVVLQLKKAGALILGKTVTTELATYAPGKTRNPWNDAHTPGGSSSGSAAAVACGMADAALGSQTNGSTIRPASFCGVVGFKPGRDRVARRGMLVQSPTFDTVGLFGPDVTTVQKLYGVLASADAPSTGLPSAPRVPARAVWWTTPWWSRVSATDQAVLQQGVKQMDALNAADGGGVDQWLPAEEIVALHGQIMEAEIARSFVSEFERGRESLSASLQGQITRGRATSDAQWAQARLHLMELRQKVDAAWPTDVDFILMPSSTGTAPEGLQQTGDPIMCTLATALDLPAISLPGLRGHKGLPLGLQLVARRGAESALLAAAHQWESACRS